MLNHIHYMVMKMPHLDTHVVQQTSRKTRSDITCSVFLLMGVNISYIRRGTLSKRTCLSQGPHVFRTLLKRLIKVNPCLKLLDLQILFIGELVKILLSNCMHALLYVWQQQQLESDMKSQSHFPSVIMRFTLK